MMCPFQQDDEGFVNCQGQYCALWTGSECAFLAIAKGAEQYISDANFQETMSLHLPAKED